jgi:hypothetical protein
MMEMALMMPESNLKNSPMLRHPTYNMTPLNALNYTYSQTHGRAIGQAVSRRLPRFDPRSGHVGFVEDKVTLGAGLLRILRFPLPIPIPPTAPHSSSIIRGWYNRAVSARRTEWPQSHPTQEAKKKLHSGSRVFRNATVSCRILSTCRSQRPAEFAVLQRKTNQE